MEKQIVFVYFVFVCVCYLISSTVSMLHSNPRNAFIYEYDHLKGEELSHTTWVLHLSLYLVHWHHNYHSDSNNWCCISNYYCYYIEFVSAVQYCVEKLYLMQSLILYVSLFNKKLLNITFSFWFLPIVRYCEFYLLWDVPNYMGSRRKKIQPQYVTL